MRRDDIDEDPLVALERRVRRLERGSSLGYSSVSEGALRILSVDGLIVEGQERVTGLLVVDGTLQVAGTQTVSGTLVVTGGQIITGTFRVDGDTTHNGKTTFVGETDVTGIFNVTGTTTITGPVGLLGTMTVTGGGKIQIGNLLLEPGGAYGGQISAGGVGVLYLDASNVIAREFITAQNLSLSQEASILGDVTAYSDVIVNDDLIVGGTLINEGIPTISGVVSNVYFDASDSTFKLIV